MLSDRMVDVLAEGVDVAIRIGSRLRDFAGFETATLGIYVVHPPGPVTARARAFSEAVERRLRHSGYKP